MLGWFRKLGLWSSAFALVALLFTSNAGCTVRTHDGHHHRGVKRGHGKKAKKPNRGRGRKAKKPNRSRGKKKGHAKGRGKKKGRR